MSTVPKGSTCSIPCNSGYELVFSQPVDPASWGGITTFAAGKHAINTKGTGASGNRVIVTPTVVPAPGTDVSLTVPASVVSQNSSGAAGSPVAPYVVQFRTLAGAGPGTYAVDSRASAGGVSPDGVALGDVDGDGDLDACMASPDAGQLDVLLNDGAAHLTPSVPRRLTGLSGCGDLDLADLDRDGDLDLLIWSPRSNVFLYGLNNGTGRFLAPVAVGGLGGTTAHIGDAGAADLNGDGWLDIFISDSQNNRIRVLPNDGAGNFPTAAAIDVPCAGGPVGVAAADMNNDGALDFVAACRDNGQVAVLLWQLSQWLPSRLVSTGPGSHPTHVDTGDLDGDGLCDFVVSCDGDATSTPIIRGSALKWLSRTPNAAPQVIRRGKRSEAQLNLRVADVDGDGDFDVVCVEDEALITCRNNGLGSFTDGGSASQRGPDKNGQDCTGPRKGNTNHPGPRGRAAQGDLDGDGDLDVVTLTDDGVCISLNQPIVPIVSISPPAEALVSRPLGPIRWMAPEALDAASLQSVVVRDNHGRAHTTASGTIISAAPDGGAALLLPAVQKVREAAYRVTVPAGRSLTGKATRPFAWTFSTRPNQSDGVPVAVGSPLALTSTDLTTMGDWDGDGGNDLIVARRGVGSCRLIYWRTSLPGNTANVFANPVTIDAAPIPDFTPTFIRAADLDADDHLDVVMTGIVAGTGAGGGPHVKVFSGASGQLLEVDDYAIPEAAVDVMLADVDHDGALDIIVATANTVQVKKSKSNISSNRSFPLPGPITAIAVEVGNPTSKSPDDPLFFLFAIGSGAGGGPHVRRIPCDHTGVLRVDEATTLTTLTGNPTGPAVADFDGDGRPDVATPMAAKHAINYKGTAATNGRVISTGAGSAPTQVCAGDLDGDGARDLVVVCPGTSSLWIGMNDGDGLFPVTRTVAVGAVPQEAWLDDCDDDGIADIVVRCADGSVRVFECGLPSPDDLVISTPTTMTSGTYHNITVLDSGVAIFPTSTCVTATGTFRVRRGGTVKGGTCIPNPFGARFILEAGATLEIPQATGLNSTTGPITGAGIVSLSESATYVYTGTGAQETGPGLPPVIGNLLLGSDLTQLTLTNPVTVAGEKTYWLTLSVQAAQTPHSAGKVNMQDITCCFGPAKKQVVSNGRLTLASWPGGTTEFDASRIEAIGDVHVQTYVPAPAGTGGGSGYRHYAPPVSGTTYGHVATTGHSPVVNPAYNTAVRPSQVRPYPTIFTFSEARPPSAAGAPSWSTAGFSFGYASPTALSDASPLGRGWSMYTPSGVTWTATGTVSPGDVDITGLTYTGSNTGAATPGSGWHLLGNPFPAVLCWDSVEIPAGLSAAAFVWESAGGANGRYLSRLNGFGNLDEGLMGVGQGFWVQVSDPATPPGGLTLRVKAPLKVLKRLDKATPLLYRQAPRPRLTLSLSGATGTDETTVYFQAGATAGLDAAFDATRPGRNVGAPTLASLSPAGPELAINGLADTDLPAGATVELTLVLPNAGSYALRVSTLVQMSGQSIRLLDRQTGARYDLTQYPTVIVGAPQAGVISGRYAVEFNGGRVLSAPTSVGVSGASSLTLYPNPATGAVWVHGAAADVPVRLLDGVGRVVRVWTPGSAELRLAGVAPGVYVVRCGTQARRLVVE